MSHNKSPRRFFSKHSNGGKQGELNEEKKQTRTVLTKEIAQLNSVRIGSVIKPIHPVYNEKIFESFACKDSNGTLYSLHSGNQNKKVS